MNKEDLEKENKKLKDVIKNLKGDNAHLIRQQKELRHMAEKAGSEMAVFKHRYLRLEQELNKLKVI